MAEAKSASQISSIVQSVPEGGSLLDTIAEKGSLGQTPEERYKGKEWIKTLADEVLKGQVKVDKDTDLMLAERIKERLHHINIFSFVSRTDIIYFARSAFFQNFPYGAAVVVNEDPIANVFPVAVNRQRFVI